MPKIARCCCDSGFLHVEASIVIRNHMTITDVAEEIGVGAWTLRRLESLGRIPAPRRDGLSGKRVYSDTDIAQLRAALERIADGRTIAVRERVPA